MKNNNTINIPCRMPKSNHAGVDVKNLRTLNDALVPVGTPVACGPSASGALIAVIGTRSVFLDDRHVKIVTSAGEELAGTLPADCRCHSVSGDTVTFMTALGVWRLTLAGTQCKIEDFTAPFPRIAVGVYGTRDFAASTPSRTLSGQYRHWTGPMAQADLRIITADLLAAYSRTMRMAAADGYYTQPVAVWYRLLDDRGQLLYRSEPVVIADGGYRGIDPMTADVALSGGYYADMGAVQVKLRGFSLGYKILDTLANDSPHVAVAEIFASPMLDPVDYAGSVTAAFGASDAVSASLGLRLPLFAALKNRLLRMLDRLETISARIAVINEPFSGSEAAMIPVDTSDVIDPSCRSAVLASLLDKKLTPVSRLMSEISLPHRFSAGAVGQASDMTVWGDITPVLALPAGVTWRCASVNPGVAWSAVTRVTLSRGGVDEILSFSESGASDCPVALSPVVAYPHSCARRIQITVAGSDGSLRGIDLRLTPAPGNCGACYVASGLKSLPLEDVDAPLSPVVSRVSRSFPSALVVAAADNPLLPAIVKQLSSGRVTAIARSPRYANSLDIGRRHICVFTDEGSYIAAVNIARLAVSCHRVDSRPVISPRAVAVTPDGIYAASTRSLLLIAGSTVKSVARGYDFSELGYSPRFGELFCRGADGSVRVLDDSGGWARREFSESVTGFCCHGGGIWAVGCNSVFDLNDESPQTVSVRYAALYRNGGAIPLGVRKVIWLFGASSFTGRLTVVGSNNAIDEVTVADYRLTGRVNLPPRALLPLCRYRCLRIIIEGETAPDGMFNEIILER